MESGILDFREVRATRGGIKINFNSLRKVVMMCRNWSSGDMLAVISAYEGFPFGFGFELGASCPLLRSAGGTADS